MIQNSDILLSGKNIKKCFRTGAGEDFYALRGVDIDIPRGKLVILKGRSGSGKTTLINALSTLDQVTEGEISFDGEFYSQMNDAKKEQLRRNEMGFVFQSIALVPIMNAYENVDFALRLCDSIGEMSDKEKDERIRHVLELVGMGERIHHLPSQMSGGEQQRVAIARACVTKPKLIFADEPTGALDTETGIKVMKLFKELIEKEGITIVMTTHDPNLMELGDVIYEMEDGELIER